MPTQSMSALLVIVKMLVIEKILTDAMYKRFSIGLKLCTSYLCVADVIIEIVLSLSMKTF